MKKELLFYNQIEFESIKTLFKSLEYEVISLSYFLDDLKDLNKFTPYKSGVCVIDVSILGGGYYNTGAIQAIGENVFRLFTNEEIIYICDNRHHDQLKYELRYCFEQFKKINLPLKAMESGIIFIWTKKDFLDNMITYIEGLENTIKYVENLVWIKLSKKQLDDNAYQGEKQYYNLDSIFYQGKSNFFSNSHMTLLFFRKEKKENDHLELKHQRTNDAVFDYMDENDNKNYTPNKFVYKMIETLLPKATFRGNKGEKMKLLEIFSNEKEGRKGWIHLKESE